MLNLMDIRRIDSAITFIKNGAFKHIETESSDDVATILAILYDYRKELIRGERKQNVVSQ